MAFTDIFIKRPVLATVVSLLILLVGAQAGFKLPIRQYPELSNTTITVVTTYPGANADLIQGFITVPIQQAVASAEGIDTLTASSTQNVSTVTLNLKLDADPDRAMTDVLSKVAQVKGILPREANDSIVTKQTGEGYALMYISFNSKVMNASQISDYITRVVQPRLQTINGVANAQMLGGQVFAMRIWLDPDRMASLGVTPLDVRVALATNNFTSAPGQVKGDFVQTNIDAKTSLQTPKAFGKLVVMGRGEFLVRLATWRRSSSGRKAPKSSSAFDGLKAVFIGVYATPTANPLTVITDVRKAFPEIQRELPPGLEAAIAYDATNFIRASLWEVMKTLGEAAIIVIVVIFLFLGNLRSTIIPIVTIPLSLIGVLALLAALGYSINLMTLLALVLAIGLVVDDAIVVVENIHRHIEQGMRPFDAALIGAREILYPIIAMTITLAAVYAPIAFVSGLTGALFREFALTLAGAVIVSGVIAVTLSPMMCSKLLKAENAQEGRLAHAVSRPAVRGAEAALSAAPRPTLNYRPVTLLVLAGLIAATGLMYMTTQRELAPEEDQGILFTLVKTPQYANLDYLEEATDQLYRVFSTVPEKEHVFAINGMGDVHQGFAGISAQALGRAEAQSPGRAARAAAEDRRHRAGAGALVLAAAAAGLGRRAAGAVRHHHDARLPRAGRRARRRREGGARKRHVHLLRFRSPLRDAADRVPDRPRQGQPARHHHGRYRQLARDAARRQLRQSVRSLRPELSGHPAGAARVPAERGLAHALPDPHRAGHAGAAVQRRDGRPRWCSRIRSPISSSSTRRRSRPCRSRADASARRIDFLKKQAERFPEGFTYDFQGESRQFVQEGNALVYTFVFALIVIFLVLAAQYRELPRPVDHPDRAADVDLRRAHPAQCRARLHQHLYPDRARDADRADLEARHSDGRFRQQAPRGAGLRAARGDRTGRGDPPEADPDDDGGNGCRHGAAAHRRGRGRRQPLRHRRRHRRRHDDRHAVHPVRDARGLYLPRQGPPEGEGRGRGDALAAAGAATQPSAETVEEADPAAEAGMMFPRA